jgi:hypothetical protein
MRRSFIAAVLTALMTVFSAAHGAVASVQTISPQARMQTAQPLPPPDEDLLMSHELWKLATDKASAGDARSALEYGLRSLERLVREHPYLKQFMDKKPEESTTDTEHARQIIDTAFPGFYGFIREQERMLRHQEIERSRPRLNDPERKLNVHPRYKIRSFVVTPSAPDGPSQR